MNRDFASRDAVRPPRSIARRMIASMWRQSSRSVVCPPEPRLDNQIALVTGGSRGIGLETSRGLARRGAEVIMASRGAETGERVARELRTTTSRPTHFAPLDLADLGQAPEALSRIEALLDGRRLDVLIANAGLWPDRHARSAQGHEIAFATNALGHHALIRGLLDRGLLADQARILIVTGDIYILAAECTPDYTYRGRIGGQLAYCRSKLGNLWYARELAKRHPSLRVHAVHPGVVASQLGGIEGGLGIRIKQAMMVSLERGAQASLYCATQPDLPSGSYFHNVLGLIDLDPTDPAADPEKARAFWDLLEQLS